MTTRKADPSAVDNNQVSAFAGAKINLSLRVVGKRSDGYHLLESLVVHALDVGDRLRVEAADTTLLTNEGLFGADLTAGADNLVLRAAHLLSPYHAAGLTLDKALPVASGIGGGSADAAACLRLLNEFWELGLTEDTLRMIGAELGADVPMCIDPVPTFVTGIGDILHPVALPPLHLVLVNPGVEVSTPSVFSQRCGPFSGSLHPPSSFTDGRAVADYASSAGNDLFEPAGRLQPVIVDAYAALIASSGCLHAAMSGSGATCFGIFQTRASAERSAKQLSDTHSAWWVRPATTRGSKQ